MNPMTRYRWVVCALIFFATTVNYLDRQMFSLLVPFFENDLRLGPTDLALINVSFILPYGLAMIFVGRALDRIGTRRLLTGSYLLWNIALIGHSLVRGLTGFMGARFVLGFGESAMFPAAVKTVTEWFPRKERALATGFFNAGANLGAVLAPLIGVTVATQFGWRTSFVITGLIGMVWVLFWIPMYREPQSHPKVSPPELEYIQADSEPSLPAMSYGELLGIRPVYALAVAKAMSDAPWWFYLFWMPKFLVDQFHLKPIFMAWAIPVIYIFADIGSISGGWLSSRLISRGMAVGPARKWVMLACALAVVPVMTVGLLVDHPSILGIPSVFWAVAIVSLAAGAHQGWSSNLFTLISDTIPKGSVGMAVGAINGFAMIGASAMQFFVGQAVLLTSSYTLPFILAGSLYLLALIWLHLMMPHVHQMVPGRSARIPFVLAGLAGFLIALAFLQYQTNKPPYTSLADYQVTRKKELNATLAYEGGPTAKVGWMDARWFRWWPAGKPQKIELIKFDQRGQAFIESKGDQATKYSGEPAAEVVRFFGTMK